MPSDSIPPQVAHDLLMAKDGLPPTQWAFFKAAFTKARESYSPEHALRLAIEALNAKFPV